MNAKVDQSRVAAILAKTEPPRRKDNPEQLVALARKGYLPSLAVLKARAARCPKHAAAFDSLVREANGTPAPAATPAPRREQWVATVPPKPSAAAPPAAALAAIKCNAVEFQRMSSADRKIFFQNGGIVRDPPRSMKVEIAIARQFALKPKR